MIEDIRQRILFIEQYIVSGLMHYPSDIDYIYPHIEKYPMCKTIHQDIIKSIKYLINKNKESNILSICEYLKINHQYKNSSEAANYISWLYNDCPGHESTVSYRIQSYLDVHKLIQAKKIVLDLSANLENESFTLHTNNIMMEMRDALEGHLTNLATNETKNLVSETIDWLQENACDTGIPGIPFGLDFIDKRTGGMQPSQFIVLGARTTTGKTAMAVQIANNAAKKCHVQYFSLEDEKKKLMCRIFSQEYRVTFSGLAFAHEQYVREFAEKFARDDKVSKLQLDITDDVFNLDDICQMMTDSKNAKDTKLFVVDHIGLVSNARIKDVERVSLTTRTLKLMSKKLDTPILALAQLSRACEDTKGPPTLVHLRDSGSTEQDADMVILMHTPKECREERPKPVDLIIAKNKLGPTATSKDHMFDGRYQTIYLNK